ncbi:hypothetical protein V5O48_016522 [Marasmius crinis-equi]|uniref:Uncharacterized protein n=1 Tax=Marasmius crinis-equi TaxID=585013 RepID=A0ABR3ERR9_9AGAR
MKPDDDSDLETAFRRAFDQFFTSFREETLPDVLELVNFLQAYSNNHDGPTQDDHDQLDKSFGQFTSCDRAWNGYCALYREYQNIDNVEIDNSRSSANGSEYTNDHVGGGHLSSLQRQELRLGNRNALLAKMLNVESRVDRGETMVSALSAYAQDEDPGSSGLDRANISRNYRTNYTGDWVLVVIRISANVSVFLLEDHVSKPQLPEYHRPSSRSSAGRNAKLETVGQPGSRSATSPGAVSKPLQPRPFLATGNLNANAICAGQTTEWDDLETDIRPAPGVFVCPAGDYPHGTDLADVRRHMLSLCCNASNYRQMHGVPLSEALDGEREEKLYTANPSDGTGPSDGASHSEFVVPPGSTGPSEFMITWGDPVFQETMNPWLGPRPWERGIERWSEEWFMDEHIFIMEELWKMTMG